MAGAGVFGKLPSATDFVHRGLPRAFVDPMDAWMQNIIAAGKKRDGEGWIETFLSAPVWRFALLPGVVSPHAWAGVLASSVDAIGRPFPLFLAAASEASNPHAEAVDPWAGQADDLAVAAIAGDVSVDELARVFDGAAADVPGLPLDISAVVPATGTKTDTWQPADTAGAFIDTVFWHAPTRTRAAVAAVSPGLPPTSSALALFDEHWRDLGWEARP